MAKIEKLFEVVDKFFNSEIVVGSLQFEKTLGYAYLEGVTEQGVRITQHFFVNKTVLGVKIDSLPSMGGKKMTGEQRRHVVAKWGLHMTQMQLASLLCVSQSTINSDLKHLSR